MRAAPVAPCFDDGLRRQCTVRVRAPSSDQGGGTGAPPTDAASDATIQSPFATPVNFTAKVAALRQEFGLSADASYSEVAENVVSNFGLRPVDAEHGRPVAAVIREGYTEVFGVD